MATNVADNEAKIHELLRNGGMSITANRVQILGLFFKQTGNALRHADIESALNDMDRVTIYRTLHTFLEKGLLHTVPNTDGNAMYALCKEECHEGHHHDDHVHFLCNRCGVTTCLDGLVVPQVNLPQGFAAQQTEMIISGTCNACNS